MFVFRRYSHELIEVSAGFVHESVTCWWPPVDFSPSGAAGGMSWVASFETAPFPFAFTARTWKTRLAPLPTLVTLYDRVAAPPPGTSSQSEGPVKVSVLRRQRYCHPVMRVSPACVHARVTPGSDQVAVSPVAAAGSPPTATATVSAADCAPAESVTRRLKVSVAFWVSVGAVKVGEAAVALLRVTAWTTLVAGGVATCTHA